MGAKFYYSRTIDGHYPCQYPECDRKHDAFNWLADLGRHYADDKVSVSCSYLKRTSSQDIFAPKDHHREYIRNFQKEDLGCGKGETCSKNKGQWTWQEAQTIDFAVEDDEAIDAPQAAFDDHRVIEGNDFVTSVVSIYRPRGPFHGQRLDRFGRAIYTWDLVAKSHCKLRDLSGDDRWHSNSRAEYILPGFGHSRQVSSPIQIPSSAAQKQRRRTPSPHSKTALGSDSDDWSHTFFAPTTPSTAPSLNPLAAMNLFHCSYGCSIKQDFVSLGLSFHSTQIGAWISPGASHAAKHHPPPTPCCTFCDLVFENIADPNLSWRPRMGHIAIHFQNRARREDMRPDFFLIEHMRKKGLLSAEDYKWAIRHTKSPGYDSLVRYPLVRQPLPTLAAAREYLLFGQDTIISSDQAIRIHKSCRANPTPGSNARFGVLRPGFLNTTTSRPNKRGNVIIITLPRLLGGSGGG